MTEKADKIEKILNVIFKGKEEVVFSNMENDNEKERLSATISRTDAKKILESTEVDDIDMHYENALENNTELASHIILVSYHLSLRITELGSEKDQNDDENSTQITSQNDDNSLNDDWPSDEELEKPSQEKGPSSVFIIAPDLDALAVSPQKPVSSTERARGGNSTTANPKSSVSL